jgi:NAD(P)-dependent dehydrogenase (short-subunit alcohol dehydrogenase family)
VLEGVSVSGKRVLVTGVSAGLGVETARALAAHGAEVVGAAIARIVTSRRSSPTQSSPPASSLTRSTLNAKALWAKSEELVGERF